MRRFDELLIIICQFFNNKQIHYFIRGGVAVLFQGRFRTTEDINIIVSHSGFNDQDFIDFCNSHNLSIDPYDLEEGKSDGGNITIMDFPNSIRIDMRFLYSRWDKEAILLAEDFNLNDIEIKVVSPEYLIVNKIYKGSRIDIEDAYSVYYQNMDRLDVSLMEYIAEMLSIEKEFKEFIKKGNSDNNLLK